MSKDWHQVIDGRWQVYDPTRPNYEICCDCSLTHRMEMKVGKDGKIRWRVWRDDKQTKLHRRKFKNTAASIA